MEIPVVSNPRRRRRRRRYTAKQRAAGFGGRRRRRRNPSLAALANPRRRRYYARPRRRRGRRYRNPRMRMLGMIDFRAGMWTAGGMLGTKIVPAMVSKFVPQIPVAGPIGYVTKIVSAALIGWGVRQFAGRQQAQYAVNGAMALILYDAFTEYVAPRIGLPGLSGFVSTDELAEVTGGISGFIPAPSDLGLGRYAQVSENILAA